MRNLSAIAPLFLTLAVTITACDKTDATPKPAASAPVGSGTVSSTTAPAKPTNEIPWSSTNPQALEAFKTGIEMTDNARFDEARDQFKKALSLDPKFTSASAMVGATTPNLEGEKMIAEAITAGAALPEAEQLNMKLVLAVHTHDIARATEITKKLTELLPGSWHAHFINGRFLNLDGKQDAAIVALKKAIELDATAAPPYNDLGYAEMNMGKTDDAITHFKKYVEMRPKEPNPQDSLAEALLMGGKLDESEAAFKKAAELDAQFNEANEGVGYVHLYKNDYAGAFEAFNKFNAAAPNLAEKEQGYRGLVLGQLAQGKPADALKTLDAWDADIAKAKDDREAITSSAYRELVLIESGKSADAIALVTKSLEKIDKLDAPDVLKAHLRGYQRVNESIADARLSKKAEADKAAAALQELFGKSDEGQLKGLIALGQGEAALAKGDSKAAVEAFKNCWALDDYCGWERSKAEEKAGDKAASMATKERLAKIHRRDPVSFFAWSKVTPAAAAAAPAAAATAAPAKK